VNLKTFFKTKLFKNKYATPNDPNSNDHELAGVRVAILATDGFEQVELLGPQRALQAAGANVFIIAPKNGRIRAWDKDHWGIYVKVDMNIQQALTEEFDYLVLPGGVLNPDQLRMNHDAITFVKTFFNTRKMVASICHGPQLIIETGMVKGRTLTSYPSIKTDLINAGAHWVDQEVVVGHGLITSRKPSDLRVFNNTIIKEFTYRRPRAALPNTEGYVVTM
jgi:protease I